MELSDENVELISNLAFYNTLIYRLSEMDIDAQGKTIREIIESKEYTKLFLAKNDDKNYVLNAYLETHPEIGNAKVLKCTMHDPSYNDASFSMLVKQTDNSYAVVYRGTADGEWIDNTVAFQGNHSEQQKSGLRFYEECITEFGIKKEDTLYITGHSKGGNKAQYAFMYSKYGDYCDACYNFDGQGFSHEAVTDMKAVLGNDFDTRKLKVYGIYGENDFVHVLGEEQIVPKENQYYIATEEAKTFANYHESEYLIMGGNLGEFSKEKSVTVMVKDLNEIVAGMNEIPKKYTTEAIMGIVESIAGNKYVLQGVNKETVSLHEYASTLSFTIPILAGSILNSEYIKDKFSDKGVILGYYISQYLPSFTEKIKNSPLFRYSRCVDAASYVLPQNDNNYVLVIDEYKLCKILEQFRECVVLSGELSVLIPNTEILHVTFRLKAMETYFNEVAQLSNELNQTIIYETNKVKEMKVWNL